LRLDVNNYPTSAPGNLTGDTWDYGLRNPWRFSFDRSTGDLYLGDVGQGDYEEIDIERAGTGHYNYGWPIVEASHCFGSTSCDSSATTLPFLEYTHTSGGRAVIGGYVYRGSRIPSLVGRYLYGDLSGSIRSATWDPTVTCAEGVTDLTTDLWGSGATPQPISSFGEGNDGELYVTSVYYSTQAVYRIDPE
jgi:glucose/arabinose dehydrogenase